MSASAFELALARLYTDASLRELFLRDPTGALSQFDLTDQERADLACIDRAGLVMAAASFDYKRSRRSKRGFVRRLIARIS